MQKPKEVINSEILADFDTGRFKQRELAKKHNMSLGYINKVTKGREPKNIDFVAKEVENLESKKTLTPLEVKAIETVAKDEVYGRYLIKKTTHKNLERIDELLDKNTKQKAIVVGNGETQIIDLELEASDYKNAQDAIDKASLTIGINERFSKTNITNVNGEQKIIIEHKTLDKPIIEAEVVNG